MDVIGERRQLVPLALRCYKQGKLNEIIDPDLKGSESVKQFSEIAYQCLHDDQEERPSMDFVLQKLETVLELLEYEEACEEACELQEYEEACELQLLEEALGLQKLVKTWQVLELDDASEIQELMEALELYKLGDILELETDYAVIKAIHMMTKLRPTCTTREEIYTQLSSGILINDNKVWFSIDENGYNEEMISALKFMHEDENTWEHMIWNPIVYNPTSVFPMLVRVLDPSKFNMEVKIRTQFLSSNVSYAAYIVCKHEYDKSKPNSIHALKQWRIQRGGLGCMDPT